jgi:Trk K+ transport system NAD-binding subunit
MRWPRAFEERFAAPGRDGDTEPRKNFVVCGDDSLAHRLVDELARRYVADVTVILPAKEHNHGPDISRTPGVRIIESDRLDADTFRVAKIGLADALALVQQNDVGNIDAALIAQELNPHLRLIVRMFNMSLGHRVRHIIPNCSVLSDATMASPVFLSAALGEVELNHVRLSGRTLYIARRSEVRPSQVMCGLAVSSPAMESGSTARDEGPEVLPADQERADLVLAVADGHSPVPTVSFAGTENGDIQPSRKRRRYTWRLPAIREALRTLVDRKLWLAALALVAVLLLGTVGLALSHSTPLNLWDAAYYALVTAVGGTSPDFNASFAEQALQAIITVAGIALVPVVTAAVVEAVINARLAIALGRLRQPYADHVVVIGLGNVGTRVIRGLHEFGVPVVAIDRINTARGADLARRLDIPLIIGDASQEATLRSASVQTCRALLVLSTDDNVNLEAALNGQALKPNLRIVLRLFDGDFARRVQRAFGIAISHSVSYVAAPAFAAAMMEREVLATIPVARRVLLIAEVPVGPGSDLDGATVESAVVPGQVSVIALHPHLEPRPHWKPLNARTIAAHDRLIVVTTRAGLASIVERSTSPEPALSEPAASEDRGPHLFPGPRSERA